MQKRKKYTCNDYTYKMMVRISQETKEKLEIIAEESGNKFTDTVRNIIEDYIDDYFGKDDEKEENDI